MGRPFPLMDEIQLVLQAKTDDAAFTLLYERYLPKIFSYVMKRVGNREETEDIVSQTFLKMTEKLSKFDAKNGSFKSWLYTIATHTMIDYFRRTKFRTHQPLGNADETPSADADPRQQASAEQERVMVFHALVQLPDKYQKILMLKFYSDMEHNEIAETLGLTVNYVGVLLHRALQKFKLCLKTLNNN